MIIIAEIKIKHLKVRISEFEDIIFDKNILPIFTTSSLIKEVESRKSSIYNIETLNPNKKLTFKVVSFNEIIEDLTSKINKISIDLEPFYYTDPSNYSSLDYKVKEILSENQLIEDLANIKTAKYRIQWSTLKKKKLILISKTFRALKAKKKLKKRIFKYKKYFLIRKIKEIRRRKKNNKFFNINSIFVSQVRQNKKNNKKITKKNIKSFFNIKRIFKYRFLKYISLNYITLLLKVRSLLVSLIRNYI